MRHFVFNQFFAFVFLSINQLVSLKDKSVGLCITSGGENGILCPLQKRKLFTFSGFLIQYYFLASFTFMTLMSAEVSLLMK